MSRSRYSSIGVVSAEAAHADVLADARRRLSSTPSTEIVRFHNEGRESSVDTLRGLACILVVTYHVNQSYHAYNPTYQGLHSTSAILDFVNDLLIMVRMPLFTFLSGYLYAITSRKSGSIIRYLLLRWRLLLLPLLSVGMIHAGIRNILPGSHLYTPVSQLWRVVLFPFDHYWYLQAMMWIVAAVTLLELLKLLSVASVWLLVFLAAVAAHLWLRFPIDFFSINGAIYLAPFFMLGVGVKRFDGHFRQPSIGRLSFIVCLGAFIIKGMLLIVNTQVSPATLIDLHLLGGISVCLVLIRMHVSWAPLAAVGVSSYPIYLFHIFGVGVARIALNRFEIQSVWPHVFFGVAAGLILPLFIAACAERSRISRLLLLGH